MIYFYIYFGKCKKLHFKYGIINYLRSLSVLHFVPVSLKFETNFSLISILGPANKLIYHLYDRMVMFFLKIIASLMNAMDNYCLWII